MGIEELSGVLRAMRAMRFRWFGHTRRATSCIKTIIDRPTPGGKCQGGQHKTWMTCIKSDQKAMSKGAEVVDPQRR